MGKGIAARIAAVAAALVIMLAMAACAQAVLLVDSDSDGVHVVAENEASGTATDNIVIEPGHGLCINHTVDKGSFHVKAVDGQGAVVFDGDLTNNIADFVPATGEIDLVITAYDATGTIDIIAYDVEAQAQADATLDEALSQAGVSAEAR